MTRHGSLQNMLYDGAKNVVEPAPGMGATRLSYTDRTPYTVSRVAGKTLWAREDKARPLHQGMTDAQQWEITPNPDAGEEKFTLRKDGSWREAGGQDRLLLGHRDRYYDYSF